MFLPSDPEQPPAAFRVEQGVVEVLIPDCDDQEILSAAVNDFSADADPDAPPVWTASGHVGDGQPPTAVRFGATDWTRVEGSFAHLTSAAFDIETNHGTHGGALSPEDFEAASALSPGRYLSGLSTVSEEEFANLAREYCSKSRTD